MVHTYQLSLKDKRNTSHHLIQLLNGYLILKEKIFVKKSVRVGR